MLMNFCFTLDYSESEEFEWKNPVSTVITANDIEQAIRDFRKLYCLYINEIGHYEIDEDNGNGFVVYLNSLDGLELVFVID